MTDPERSKMTMMHFFGWEKGLKTGQYYFRSRPARDAIKFTVDFEALQQVTEQKDEKGILNVLDKIGKKTPEKSSINLAKKASAPVGGFSDQVKAPELKKQKTEEATKYGGWND